MAILLTFLYVFNFKLIKGITFSDSSVVVLLYIFMACIFNKNLSRNVFLSAQSKYNKMIVKTLILLISIATVVPVVRMTFDFSYVSTLLHQLIVLIIGFYLVAFLHYKKKNILECLISSFFAQSIIQLSCFISPAFLRATDIFRDDGVITIRNTSYRGFRGLGISGSGYYGLAVSYAVLFVLLSFYFDKWKKPIPFKIVAIGTMLFGAASAGRTALIGAGIAVIIFLYKTFRALSQKVIRNIAIAIGLTPIAVAALWNPLSSYLAGHDSWKHMQRYLLQFLKSDSQGASVSLRNVSSFAGMIDNMYFKLSLPQIFFGDGMFTEKSGAYYMHTDVGFMRNLLFFGVFFTLLLYFYQYKFLMFNAKSKKSKSVAFALFITCAIMELKGQAMGFLLISQAALLLICSNYSVFDADGEDVKYAVNQCNNERLQGVKKIPRRVN